ncbi:MAG: response regulator [Burkholderiales bacterium]|jgi:two-component system nitrate/nitrite response regulator NarL|nr:response regulator [Burkholderiales bacterium]
MNAHHPAATATDPIRIVVIDDHTLFRRGIIALLQREDGFAVIGEAADGLEGVRRVTELKPDVVLLDLHMPGVSGLDAMKSILEEAPGTRVVMLTVSEQAEDLMAALKTGALGYLLKNIDSDFLVASVRKAARGESVISGEMTGKLMQELRGGDKPSLSPRERQILVHLARGSSNKEIARELAVAESTVKIHVQHILRKLGLASRVQAAVWAIENGIAAKA